MKFVEGLFVGIIAASGVWSFYHSQIAAELATLKSGAQSEVKKVVELGSKLKKKL